MARLPSPHPIAAQRQSTMYTLFGKDRWRKTGDMEEPFALRTSARCNQDLCRQRDRKTSQEQKSRSFRQHWNDHQVADNRHEQGNPEQGEAPLHELATREDP